MVKFSSSEDRDKILYSRPLIMKIWESDFNLKTEFLRLLPLWVKFPNLPFNCWGTDSLSRIVSTLGTPIIADDCITKLMEHDPNFTSPGQVDEL